MNASTLTIGPDEKTYLDTLLQEDLAETRVEVRRTLKPDIRDDLRQREDLIRGLLEKLRIGEP